MLRKKELADIAAREAEMEKRFAMLDMKTAVIGQMKEQEHLRQQARKEYEKERNQVDRIINKMIEEDHEMMRITKMKQEQSKQDMILSVNEKKALVKRQRELEQYEEELVRRYQGQQAARGEELANIKAAAEAQRDAIFKKLAAEEAARRAEFEYVENMRNELNVQEQVMNLAKTSIIQKAWANEQRPHLHGWVYGLKDGLINPVFEMPAGTHIDSIYEFDNLKTN